VVTKQQSKKKAHGSSAGGNKTCADFPKGKLAFGSVCKCTESPKPEYDLKLVIQHITTPGQTIAIVQHTVDQEWQLFDDSTVRAPNPSDWCSTRVYVMVYQRHANTGMSNQYVSQNDGGCNEHFITS